MISKNFYSFDLAKRYFNLCSRDSICFLIEDHENDVFSVVDEDTFRHLKEDFDLHMSILWESV